MSYDQTQRKYQRELGRVIELVADQDDVEQSEPTAETLLADLNDQLCVVCGIGPISSGMTTKDMTRENMLDVAAACVRLAKRM